MTEWSPFIHSVFGEIGKNLRGPDDGLYKKKPWVFVVNDLRLSVREVGGSKYIEVLELDRQTGDVISKIMDPNSGKTMEMEPIIFKYLEEKKMDLSQIGLFEKIKILQQIFEEAYEAYAHFRLT